MIFNFFNYKEYLQAEYDKRNSFNSLYSKRAFAKDIGLSPSRLSEVLKSKGGLSQKKAQSIADALNLNAMEKDFFCTLVQSVDARSELTRATARIKIKKFGFLEKRQMSLKLFEIVSNWEHLAILELLTLKGSKKNISWISKKLDISKEETKFFLNNLSEVDLIQKKGTLYFRKNDDLLLWPSEVSSRSIQNYHASLLNMALKSLYTTALDDREFNSLVVPINKDCVAEVKKQIQEFCINLSKQLSKNKNKEEVYFFTSQFFPLISRS